MKTISTLAARFATIFSFNAAAAIANTDTAEAEDSGSLWYLYGIGSI